MKFSQVCSAVILAILSGSLLEFGALRSLNSSASMTESLLSVQYLTVFRSPVSCLLAHCLLNSPVLSSPLLSLPLSSQYLMALAQDAPAERRGNFLDYKGLKKVLKQLQ